MSPLITDGEDFFQLLETGCLEHYEDSLNKRIWMGIVLKYPKLEKLEDISLENQIILQKSLKSLSVTTQIYINTLKVC